MRRVGVAFDLFVWSLPAAALVAALVFFSWDTLRCHRDASGAARCELLRIGLLGDSGALVREPDLNAPTDSDDSGTSLTFWLDGHRSERVPTTESRGRRVVERHREFVAGTEREMSVVVSLNYCAISFGLLALAALLAGVALTFPSHATVHVFDDGRVEVETARPLRRATRETFSLDTIDEVRVEPQEDGELAHLMFVANGRGVCVFTGLPDALERAQKALSAELINRRR